MTDNQSNPTGEHAPLRRRRLLGGVGAGALAAAVAVFGRGTPAFAANWQCCNLLRNPPNLSMGTCLGGTSEKFTHYVWTCRRSNGSTCRCCEKYQDGNLLGSAGSCP